MFNWKQLIIHIVDKVDLPEEDVHDNEYVPPAVIFDEDCDYDEFDPDEVIPEEELTDIQKEFDYMKENLKMDLAKTGNYIPIWVHVDSVEVSALSIINHVLV